MSAEEARYDCKCEKATKENCDELWAEDGEVGEADQDVDDRFDGGVETVLHYIRDHVDIIILSADFTSNSGEWIELHRLETNLKTY